MVRCLPWVRSNEKRTWLEQQNFQRVLCPRRCEIEVIAEESGLMAEAHVGNNRTEKSDSSLHEEFPPSWLKYQHIAATFPPSWTSFNHLLNKRGTRARNHSHLFHLWRSSVCWFPQMRTFKPETELKQTSEALSVLVHRIPTTHCVQYINMCQEIPYVLHLQYGHVEEK